MTDNRKGGMHFRNCYNVTVRGVMIIRNKIVPFSQGRIESIDGNSFVITIADGYPTILDNSSAFSPTTAYYVFDRTTRRLKDNTYDYYNTTISRVDSRRFLVLFGRVLGQELAVGDLVGMRSRMGGTGVHSDLSERMPFIDINAESAGAFAWSETKEQGNHRYERISARSAP